MYKEYGIDEKIEKLAKKVEADLEEEFKKVSTICEKNSLKVLKAFQKYRVSEVHFNQTTGYGYGDIGRETIEKIFAEVLGAEDALVRAQFISGTHALTVTLFGLLRPGDTMLSITGKPYDTLDTVIGLENNNSSLMAHGVKYEQIDLLDNEFDDRKIIERVKEGNVKLIEIQRSRGYSTRDSIDIDKLKNIVQKIKNVNKNVIIMVDNCYCEFVAEVEPAEVGADIVVRFFN